MQELIEFEASEQVGAAGYERTDGRTNARNGNRRRLLSQADDIELKSPSCPMAACCERVVGATDARVE